MTILSIETPYARHSKGLHWDDQLHLAVILVFDGSECTVTLAGSLCADSVIALESQFEQLCSGDFDRVILEVEKLSMLDSFGVEALARLHDLMAGKGTVLTVRSGERVCNDPESR